MTTKHPPQTYTLDIERGIFQANDAEDHKRMMEAAALALQLRNAAPTQQAVAPASDPLTDDTHTLKLGELVEKYLLLKTAKQATAAKYRADANELARFLKNPAISRITQSDITRFQEHLAEKKNSKRTVDNKVGTIRALLSFAKKQGYMRNENPAAGRSLQTKRQRTQSGYAIFERDEIAAIFSSEFFKEQQKKDPDYTNAVLLGVFTGCRIGELTNLKREQFKKTENGIHYITIRDSKTVAGVREVPLHPVAYASLKDFIESQRDKIFKYVEREGKGTGNAVGKKFARNLESAHITREKLVFHSLRKFVNNELTKAGVSIEQRCQFIGHELENVNVSTYTNRFSVEALAAAVFPTFEAIVRLVSLTPAIELPDLDDTLSW